MARVETIVVGGGINGQTPFTVNRIPYILQTDPPFLAPSPIMTQVTGVNRAIVISPTAADPQAAATTILRVVGGIASFTGTTANDLLRCVLGARQTLTNLAGLNNHTIIGNDINVDTLGTGSTIVGHGITRTATGGGGSTVVVALGASISVGGGQTDVIAIGASVAVGDANGGASGKNTYVGNNIAVTGGAVATQRNTLIGQGITSGASAGINSVVGSGCVMGTAIQMAAIGYNNQFANGLAYGSVLGLNNTINHSECVLLGSGITTTAANQCLIGGLVGGAGFINTVIIGRGDTAAAPNAVTVRLSNSTGNDVAAGKLTIQAGISTGNAAPGSLAFRVGSQVAGSGGALQTAFDAMTIDNDNTDVKVNVLSPAASGKDAIHQYLPLAALAGLVGGVGVANGLVVGSAVGEMAIRTANARLLFSMDNGATLHADFTAGGVLELNVNRGLRMNNATSSAGAGGGTLGNAPTAGNPGFWLKININGTNYAIPCWLG